MATAISTGSIQWADHEVDEEEVTVTFTFRQACVLMHSLHTLDAWNKDNEDMEVETRMDRWVENKQIRQQIDYAMDSLSIFNEEE